MYPSNVRRGRVVKCLQGQIVPMSLHKFASNVVEKALTHGTPEQRSTLVSEMLDVATASGPASHASHAGLESQEGDPNTDSGQAMQPLHELMKDQYGNYVVQKTLEVRDSHTVSSLHHICSLGSRCFVPCCNLLESIAERELQIEQSCVSQIELIIGSRRAATLIEPYQVNSKICYARCAGRSSGLHCWQGCEHIWPPCASRPMASTSAHAWRRCSRPRTRIRSVQLALVCCLACQSIFLHKPLLHCCKYIAVCELKTLDVGVACSRQGKLRARLTFDDLLLCPVLQC